MEFWSGVLAVVVAVFILLILYALLVVGIVAFQMLRIKMQSAKRKKESKK